MCLNLTLKNYLVFFSALVLSSALASKAAMQESHDDEFFERSDEVEFRKNALVAAYEEARKRRLESVEKTVVVSRKRSYIVVSFLNTKRQIGGESHFVYDPVSKKIVWVNFSE